MWSPRLEGPLSVLFPLLSGDAGLVLETGTRICGQVVGGHCPEGQRLRDGPSSLECGRVTAMPWRSL